jgi:hypothetical protein
VGPDRDSELLEEVQQGRVDVIGAFHLDPVAGLADVDDAAWIRSQGGDATETVMIKPAAKKVRTCMASAPGNRAIDSCRPR